MEKEKEMSIHEGTNELDVGSLEEKMRNMDQETNEEAERERPPVDVIILKEGEDSVEATVVTERRLTDSDLDEEKGYLSITESEFKNAIHFLSRNEKKEIESGRSVPVKLVQYNGVKPVNAETSVLLRKSKTSYELTGGWNEFKRRNEEKLKGADGLHALIRLCCFRRRNSKIRLALIVKQPEMPERMKNRLKYVYASEAVFCTEKRLTDSDLDQEEGCLAIPETGIVNIANLFTSQETELLDLGQPVAVGLLDIPNLTIVQLIRKPDKGYVLTQKWNEVIRGNASKYCGVDGIHAVIQLWCFRYSSMIYLALNISEEPKALAAAATASDGSGGSNTNPADVEASATHEKGPLTLDAEANTSEGSNVNTGDAEATANDGSNTNTADIEASITRENEEEKTQDAEANTSEGSNTGSGDADATASGPKTESHESGSRNTVIVKQPELSEGLKIRLILMNPSYEPVFVTEKRLTDSDLNRDEGCCLSIPEAGINNIANLFTSQETELLDLGEFVHVGLHDMSGFTSRLTIVRLIRKPDKGYALTHRWKEVLINSSKNFIGVDGLHAVIRLWFFRCDDSRPYLALEILEAAATRDAESSESDGSYTD